MRTRWTGLVFRAAHALLLVVALGANAATVHHWRFEGARFLEDSAGSATLTNVGTAQTPHPGVGPGSAFPPITGRFGATIESGDRLTAEPGDLPTTRKPKPQWRWSSPRPSLLEAMYPTFDGSKA